MPSEHCQSPLRHLERNLDHQHQSLRQRKLYRYGRNPIISSPQYQAYRARQSRDGNQEDAKWPEILEAAFLDALIDIPAMGRRKFSYKGKPHGRNELIKEYIWIAYLQSLAPGQRPDPSMARDRKQVSSHIQVLKGFLKDHPAFSRLFPSNKSSKNGFEDSFKNDPCLRALSQGRLPSRRYEHCNDLSDAPPKHPQPSVKPAVFWLLVTSAQIQEDCGDLYEMDTVTHRYSRLSGQVQHVNLDSILNWCQKFPYLEPLCSASELDCEIIHMDVSLNLMETHAQDGTDLVTRSEISVTNQGNETSDWQTVTSFMKPPELSQDYCSEQHLETTVAPTKVLFSNANETRLKVRFPAEEWANILTRLTDLQLKYEGVDSCHTFGKERFLDSGLRPMQEYLQRISMYQEVQSCSSPGMPFLRRAIILWTFRAATAIENAATTWRYVDAPMSQTWMSPSSSSSQQLSAASTDNFNAWITSPSQLQLQHQDVLDPYVCGLVTPPSTAGLHSNFVSEAYGYHDQRFNVYPENFSVASTSTAHTEPAFRDDIITSNIDAYLSNTVDARIGCFGNSPTNWNLSNTESVNAGPIWPNYAALPPNSSHVGGEGDVINHGWHIDMDPRLTNWTENRDGKGNWTEMAPTMQKAVNVEQSGDKLQCWLDPANTESKGIFAHGADEAQIPKLSPRPTGARDASWIENDSSFDFNQLVERMRT